ncbi:hypothetical protein VTN00DRAFT_2517 [Thermoascus crustaceus]|uniref:uncharacterized protein n=1 Tax=Thermoascus crustaceus TaxID=5088 RepID=UPI00374235AF
MATDTEDYTAYAAELSPTQSDTAYRTPPRQSLRRRDSSPVPSSSASLPLHDFSPEERGDVVDIMNRGSIATFDPRRFTPTLHASLVSEILSLRRELESKTKVIDELESSLDDTRTENEALNESLSKSTKETRSLKRQLQLLEGGTGNALSELTKERDEALQNISEVRKRLEQAQKRVRTQEEEVERTQMLWDRDKQSWEGERRNLERKVHVVEGRLKVVLNEVAAAQAARSLKKAPEADIDESAKDDDDATAKGSDTASIRSGSDLGRRRTSTTSITTQDEERHNSRHSVMSMANGYGAKPQGLNLAEELAFDEEEENIGQSGDEFAPDSPEALPEEKERPLSVHSQLSMAMKARKILGLSWNSSVDRLGTPDSLEQARAAEVVPDFAKDEKFPPAHHADYRDIGVQYSPPPSPQLPSQSEALRSAENPEERTQPPPEKHAPNEGRKRTSATVTTSSCQMKDSSTVTLPIEMVSTSCQTIGDLPSPPLTPKLPELEPQSTSAAEKAMTNSISTQTDEIVISNKEENEATHGEKQQRLSISIPTIAIYPPGSDPPSPRSVVLPPQTKSVSCQTNFRSIVDVRSVGMQTEEIRIDKRPVKLPASLLPSAIPDQPPTAAENGESPIQPYRPPPPRSSRTPLRSPPILESPAKISKGKQPEKVQAYPGNNDNGPLSQDTSSGIRRPLRTSSLFAGFENISDEELPDAEPDMFSDDELFNRPMVSYTLRRGKLVSKARSSFEDSPLREIDEPGFGSDTEMHDSPINNGTPSRSTNRESVGSSKRTRPSRMSSGSRQQDIRRTAMISSGAAARQVTRPRSPSEPSINSGSAGSSVASQPPFPVPIRLSSRKVPISASDGAQSPTPYGSRNSTDREGRPIARRPTLRKVRSAAAISRAGQSERTRSRSPPAMSTSSYAPDSPRPPMPYDDITAPRDRRAGRKPSSRRTGSSRTHSHKKEDSRATSVQQTSVVDAIAQTMVGEWMYKYVRRRKSFGVSDSKDGWEIGKNTDEVSANITSNGVRHKRWVWLAPYERAVMWSSKQPTSGSALLGKSGRKLLIQSVLDVKDDNPLPKGASPQSQFNRSILILTPQRALKFTAMTLERHFVWLTALSFLSHSATGMNDLAGLPPVPQENSAPSPSTAALRRNPIRDSIKVAKVKPLSGAKGNRSFNAHPVPVPEIPMDRMEGLDPVMDAADPPNVPRFSSHARKRSNTAPRAPPSALRSFASQVTMPSTYSATTAGSSDIYAPSSIGHGFNSGGSSFSRRTSDASGPSSVGTGNFFDAVGTVRMEAFIHSTNNMGRYRGGYRSRHSVRRDSSQWGSGHHDIDFPRSEDGSEIYFRNEDPFRGF